METVDPLAGMWQGYDGEWRQVSRKLTALVEAIPEAQFEWRPAPGLLSIREVVTHMTTANFYLLSVTGPVFPAELKSAMKEKTLIAKADLMGWLQRSLDAVQTAHAGLNPSERQRPVKVMNRDAHVEGMFLRIIVHANEHMGQLIAYARMNGIVPPWSEK